MSLNADIRTDSKMLRADELASRYLAEYNERVEAGKDDAAAARLYAKADYWLARLNKLRGW